MQDNTQTPIQDYFTEEIMSRIKSMTDTQMMDLLKGLEGTDLWIAILRYNQKRLSYTQTLLPTTDPVTHTASIARTQGVMQGLSDLQNAVIVLKTNADEHERNLKESE